MWSWESLLSGRIQKVIPFLFFQHFDRRMRFKAQSVFLNQQWTFWTKERVLKAWEKRMDQSISRVQMQFPFARINRMKGLPSQTWVGWSLEKNEQIWAMCRSKNGGWGRESMSRSTRGCIDMRICPWPNVRNGFRPIDFEADRDLQNVIFPNLVQKHSELSIVLSRIDQFWGKGMWKGTKKWEIWLFTYQDVIFRDFISWSLSHQIDQGKGRSELTNLIDDPDTDQEER
jgi:hypothetical protein